MSATLDGFDLETILAPIPGDAPAGPDPREDVSPASIYFRLRDARAEAREAERIAEGSGQQDGAPPLAWRTVQTLAKQGLAQNAKDLELATWLTEALVRSAGLPGLMTGAAVIMGLVERYWDQLYPMPDEDGIATRVGPLAGLSGQGVDGSLMQPLRKTTLFRRADGAEFAYWQYELSVELAGITDPVRRQSRLDAGILDFDELEKEARAAGAAHWTALRAEIVAAQQAWEAMGAALDQAAGADSPSTSRVRDLLQAMQDTAGRFAPRDAPVAEPAAPGAPVQPGAAPMAASAGMGRTQALQRLGEVAAWFRANEPHSPMADTLEEAVRRGQMTWPELLAEIVPDTTTRHAMLTALGIKPPTDES